MPVSKRRKKNGKFVGNRRGKRLARIEQELAQNPLTLQDLINVVAYQEHVEKKKVEENQDGRE